MFPVAAIGRALGITIYSALSCPTSAIPSNVPATPNPADPWDGVSGGAGGGRGAVYQALLGLDTITHSLCPVALHAGGVLGGCCRQRAWLLKYNLYIIY